jgi:anion-transporting  ArsA/GET3 family ATPase
MPGENEVIMTGNLFGTKWRIRLDKYCPDTRIIIDWKTCADINKTEYNPILNERESFIEALGYMMRAAIYTEIEKQHTGKDSDANFVIVAVSKQDPPDKSALLLNHRQRYDYELEQVQKNMARILSVKMGHVRPKRCGCCEYCRSTKILKKIIPYYTLNPKFKEEREEEYDEAFDLEIS